MVPIQIILELNQVYPKTLFLVPYYFLFISMTLKDTLNPISSFFADDTMLFSLVKDPEIYANDLNHDLDTIRQWAQRSRKLKSYFLVKYLNPTIHT